MPILSAEPAIFPDNLMEAGPTDWGERRWWVLHTKSRQEKCLARQLHEKSVPFFLPLVPRRLKIRGKIRQSYLPLFGGYVFLLVDGEEYVAALSTRRVACALEVPDQKRLWSELTQIYRLIATGAPINAEERLVPGAPVEIQSGPLAGLRGVIVRSASGSKFIVKVDFIERGASVWIDDFALTIAS